MAKADLQLQIARYGNGRRYKSFPDKDNANRFYCVALDDGKCVYRYL